MLASRILFNLRKTDYYLRAGEGAHSTTFSDIVYNRISNSQSTELGSLGPAPLSGNASAASIHADVDVELAR